MLHIAETTMMAEIESMPHLLTLPPRQISMHRAVSAGSHIILLDRDPRIRQMLGTYLKRCGYDIKPAANAVEAFALMREQRPDALILDLLLPGISGIDVIRTVRKQPHTRDLAILVLTSITTIKAINAGRELGADDYLAKPTAVGVVAEHLAALLQRHHDTSTDSHCA